MKDLRHLGIYLFINVLVHLAFLNYPPSGAHVWRQCNTLGMSRNFSDESMNILQPRIDRRNETDGITGSHFPLYEWILGGIQKITGEHYWIFRFYSLIIFSISMLYFQKFLISQGIDDKLSFLGGLLLLSVPQFYYDSINAMPDILALTLSLISLNLYISHSKTGKISNLTGAVILGCLSGMVKFQFLIIPLASLAFYHWKNRKIIHVLISYILILIPVYLWYQYAIELTRKSNLKEFGLWIKPISTEEKLQTFWSNLSSDFPEMIIGWPLAILLIYLFVKFIIAKKYEPNLFIILWGLGFIIFYMVAIERMMHHSYYFMALIPLIVFVTIKLSHKHLNSHKWLLFVLIANFAWSFIRIIPSRWTDTKMGIPAEFKDKTMLDAIRKSIPKGVKCLVGPDVSGCIYFYFTDTEGYSFEDPNELLSVKAEGRFIEILEKNGVKYMITSHNDVMTPIVSKLKGWHLKEEHGAFKIWTLE